MTELPPIEDRYWAQILQADERARHARRARRRWFWTRAVTYVLLIAGCLAVWCVVIAGVMNYLLGL